MSPNPPPAPAGRTSTGQPRPSAVVFDFDGVLVDSEELSWRSWQEVLSGYGYEVTDADHEAALGRTLPVLYEHFAARVELPPLPTFADELTSHTLAIFDRELEVFDDAVAVARSVAGDAVPMGVASSSSTRRLSHSLELTGLRELFDVVVAGDEASRGKPAPDLYLLAAQRLGVAAADCVAIEDSPAGVAAAKAAGMRVVAVRRDHVSPDDLGDADRLVDVLDRDALGV